jgi:Icc protein
LRDVSLKGKMNRLKFLWLTDTHFDKIFPWTLFKFLRFLRKENPSGIILTGDISNGKMTCDHLSLLAQTVKCPIYFVLGNHDLHWSSIEKRYQEIRDLCKKYPNLIWMTEAGVVHINDEVAFIGTEGWYDAENGKPEYLQFTFDWFLIDDFRKLPNMNARIEAWRDIADASATQIANSLEHAIEQKYKSIYVLTHFPPWKEATRDVGTLMEKFWLPYNCNLRLGRAIERTMSNHKKRNVTVFCGHSHTPLDIRINRNIECRVGPGHYLRLPKSDKEVVLI